MGTFPAPILLIPYSHSLLNSYHSPLPCELFFLPVPFLPAPAKFFSFLRFTQLVDIQSFS